MECFHTSLYNGAGTDDMLLQIMMPQREVYSISLVVLSHKMKETICSYINVLNLVKMQCPKANAHWTLIISRKSQIETFDRSYFTIPFIYTLSALKSYTRCLFEHDLESLESLES